jgi:hypothetical protein
MIIDWTGVPGSIIVGLLFGLFALELIRRQDKARKEERAEQAVARDKQHLEWRTWMREQDEGHITALLQFADEIRASTKAINAIAATLIAHDIRTASIPDDIHRIRERLALAGIGDVEDSPIPEGKK